MARRELSIILIFAVFAVGSGLTNALHVAVGHGDCGAACSARVQPAPESRTCCDHHAHHGEGAAHHSGEADAVDESLRGGAGGASDLPIPLNEREDCPTCQFLATLSAIVAASSVAPFTIAPAEVAACLPDQPLLDISVISSHGPRAPPRIG